MAGVVEVPLAPSGWRGDVTHDDALVDGVQVASNPGGRDPAWLVVEVPTGTDADVAEVAGAHVRDRGGPARTATVLFAARSASRVTGQVEHADADEGALAFPDTDRVALERLAELTGRRVAG
jgi:hypothetical protein